MEANEQVTELLNDLVKINNDRIEGYKRAIAEAKDLDIDLKSVFDGMVKQSEGYKNELSNCIRENGGTTEDETTASGKIYRAWMDVKAKFTGSDRKTILESCEFGEDAAQRAYDAALTVDLPLPDNCRAMISEQQAALKTSHDAIRKFRDSYKDL